MECIRYLKSIYVTACLCASVCVCVYLLVNDGVYKVTEINICNCLSLCVCVCVFICLSMMECIR